MAKNIKKTEKAVPATTATTTATTEASKSAALTAITAKLESMPEKMTGKLPSVKKFAQEILDARLIEKEAKNVEEMDKALDKVVKFYASEAKRLCYAAARKSGDPMMYAIKTNTYEVIKVQTKDEVRSLVMADRDIDLLDLWKTEKNGIGANINWKWYAEKFNYRFHARVAEDLGDIETAKKLKTESNYRMNPEAMGIDVPFPAIDVDLSVSNNNLKTALKTVCSMMVGEKANGKSISANKEDIAYVLNAITALKRGGKIKVATDKDFATILKNVLRHVVFDIPYQVISDKVKKDA